MILLFIFMSCASCQGQVSFILTIQIVSKQLYSVKQENSVSIMQEDNNNKKNQIKSVHHWFSDVIVPLSSNSICAIKLTILPVIKCPQDKGDSGQGTKTPSLTEWRKKTWEKTDSVGGQFSSGQTKPKQCDLIQAATKVSSCGLCRWPSRWQGLRRGSVEMCLSKGRRLSNSTPHRKIKVQECT